MATYTRTKEPENYKGVIEDFENNMPHNRKTWKPQEGYLSVFHKYHRSASRRRQNNIRTRRNDNGPAPRIDSLVTIKGKSYQVIAKSRSQWTGDYRNGQYDVFTHLLLAEIHK